MVNKLCILNFQMIVYHVAYFASYILYDFQLAVTSMRYNNHCVACWYITFVQVHMYLGLGLRVSFFDRASSKRGVGVTANFKSYRL